MVPSWTRIWCSLRIVVVVISDLYCLKGVVSEWASALRRLMRYLGFTACGAYRDVYIIVAVYTLDFGSIINDGLPTGERYYEYILIYLDKLMVDIRRGKQVVQAISNT